MYDRLTDVFKYVSVVALIDWTLLRHLVAIRATARRPELIAAVWNLHFLPPLTSMNELRDSSWITGRIIKLLKLQTTCTSATCASVPLTGKLIAHFCIQKERWVKFSKCTANTAKRRSWPASLRQSVKIISRDSRNKEDLHLHSLLTTLESSRVKQTVFLPLQSSQDVSCYLKLEISKSINVNGHSPKQTTEVKLTGCEKAAPE